MRGGLKLDRFVRFVIRYSEIFLSEKSNTNEFFPFVKQFGQFISIHPKCSAFEICKKIQKKNRNMTNEGKDLITYVYASIFGQYQKQCAIFPDVFVASPRG